MARWSSSSPTARLKRSCSPTLAITGSPIKLHQPPPRWFAGSTKASKLMWCGSRTRTSSLFCQLSMRAHVFRLQSWSTLKSLRTTSQPWTVIGLPRWEFLNASSPARAEVGSMTLLVSGRMHSPFNTWWLLEKLMNNWRWWKDGMQYCARPIEVLLVGFGLEGANAIRQALAYIVPQVNNSGYSPGQWVLGQSPNFPGELLGSNLTPVHLDTPFEDELSKRAVAKMDIVQAEMGQKLRRALLRKHTVLHPGQPCFFWRDADGKGLPQWSCEKILLRWSWWKTSYLLSGLQVTAVALCATPCQAWDRKKLFNSFGRLTNFQGCCTKASIKRGHTICWPDHQESQQHWWCVPWCCLEGDFVRSDLVWHCYQIHNRDCMGWFLTIKYRDFMGW